MPRRPEDSINISEPFRKRIAALIADEETETESPALGALAERVGIGKTTVSNAVLYGILPSVSSLIKIADYTATPRSYVLGSSDEEEFIPAARPCTFGERLLSLIGERNLTIAAVSGAPGITFARNSIHVWLKRGNLPSLEYLYSLPTSSPCRPTTCSAERTIKTDFPFATFPFDRPKNSIQTNLKSRSRKRTA